MILTARFSISVCYDDKLERRGRQIYQSINALFVIHKWILRANKRKNEVNCQYFIVKQIRFDPNIYMRSNNESDVKRVKYLFACKAQITKHNSIAIEKNYREKNIIFCNKSIT